MIHHGHRYHHFGITVSDIDRSYAFYRDNLGMRFWNQEEALGTAPTEPGCTDGIPAPFQLICSDG